MDAQAHALGGTRELRALRMNERGPALERLITALLGASAPELTCEQCFEQLDRYVDPALLGGDPDRAVPAARAHLIGCPACHDDYESLLAYIAASTARAAPQRPD